MRSMFVVLGALSLLAVPAFADDAAKAAQTDTKQVAQEGKSAPVVQADVKEVAQEAAKSAPVVQADVKQVAHEEAKATTVAQTDVKQVAQEEMKSTEVAQADVKQAGQASSCVRVIRIVRYSNRVNVGHAHGKK